MTIGNRIAHLRKQRKLTQDALAREMGVSPQAVSKWEHDQSCPDILLLPRLAKILGVTTDQLLGASGEEAPAEPEPPVEEKAEPIPHDAPAIHVESVDGSQFDVHIDPPKGMGVALALWIMGTGALMLLGPLLGLSQIGFWMSALLSGVIVFSLRSMRRGIRFSNTIFLLCGIFTTLSCLSVIGMELDWNLAWPGIVLLFGVFLLLEQFRKKKRRGSRAFRVSGPDRTVSSTIELCDGYLTYANTFGEDHYRVAAPLLTGGDINVSFGEHVLDFSGVEAVAENCHVEVNSSFGEIRLEIPSRYLADVRLNKSFAEADIQGAPDPNPQGVIHIEANVSFGELTVRYI